MIDFSKTKFFAGPNITSAVQTFFFSLGILVFVVMQCIAEWKTFKFKHRAQTATSLPQSNEQVIHKITDFKFDLGRFKQLSKK